MDDGLPKGYQCCFCEKSIETSQIAQSVVLYAMNMKDWAEGVPDPRNQQFWAHFECLKTSCKTGYGWVDEAILGEDQIQ